MHRLAVAWYPEQKSPEHWGQDLAVMREHGIATVRILEFAWSRLERAEGVFTLDWVHDALRLARDHGLSVILCTPSAAPPRWLSREKPEILCLDGNNGQRRTGDQRRCNCPTSTAYRQACERITARLASEFAGYDHVIAWQIDNELGAEPCHCEECQVAFQAAMRARFGTLDALNAAVGGPFWSQDCWDWSQLRLAVAGSGPGFVHLAQRFWSDQTVDFLAAQVGTLKRQGIRVPITTNVNADFPRVDLWALARTVDLVSWDAYDDGYTLAGLCHAHHLIRSLKPGVPYWSLENGINAVGKMLQSPPGFNRVHAVLGRAMGQEMHAYWRWESCPYGHEQDLQGFLDYGGRPRAKLKELPAIDRALQDLDALDLPTPIQRIAVLHSWDNYWATGAYFGHYLKEVDEVAQALVDAGLGWDCVSGDQDLSGYDLVIAVGHVLVDDATLDAVQRFVARGGVLLATRLAFAKDLSNAYRTGARPALPVFGLAVAESQTAGDAHALDRSCWRDPLAQRIWRLTSQAGLPDTETHGWFEVLKPDGAEVLWRYVDGYFAGEAAACRHRHHQGQAFYLGAAVDRQAMSAVVRLAVEAAGVGPVVDVPHGAVLIRRGPAWVATNHTGQEQTLTLPAPVQRLTGEGRVTEDGRSVILPAYGWIAVQTRLA